MTFGIRPAALAALLLLSLARNGLAGDATSATVIDGPLIGVPRATMPETPKQAAARAALKVCAARWKALKSAGATADQTWTDFARTCRREARAADQPP